MIQVKLFGIAREIVPQGYFEITSEMTVDSLKKELLMAYPAFVDLKSVLVAVNEEYAQPDYLIKENDVVAIIPPVSGG